MVLLAPGTASAAVCERKPPRPKLSAQERMLRETIRARRQLGMPHGRVHVRRVNADPAARRRAVEGYFPVTRRERRYLLQRERMSLSERVPRYVRRHRDVTGPLSIEDDYPRGAYWLVRVTRDVALHRAALSRLGEPFRITRTRWTYRGLQRIQRRIDDRALEARGIHLVSSGIGGGRLHLDVATERADAAAVIRRLYGPAPRVRVVGPAPRFLACRTVENYEVEPDGVTLKVHWGDSGSVSPRHIEVIETPDTVYLGAVVETGFFENADLRGYTLPVTLAQPIGDRRVVNIEYERPLRPGPWSPY